ncbi:hypothetical protein ENBRE01_1875 [Enteropsectra breve]|nr:hypothetical protein ENBRE01_1875 [Enteropsectra breve]
MEEDLIVKELKKALEYDDIYEIYFNIKKLVIYEEIALNAETLEKLKDFIKAYTETIHIIPTDFNTTMNALLAKIRPLDFALHVKALSFLDHVNLEYFRKFYSYSKIYGVFKDVAKNIFEDFYERRYVSLLIKLLDNNDLVYKNLQPVVNKLTLYVTKDIVDKNIGCCCAVVAAIAENCPEKFDDMVILSMISFFSGVLGNPQNFVFLNEDIGNMLTETIEVLCNRHFRDRSVKRISTGLMREALANIEKYKGSTVYEEVLVIVMCTRILTPLCKLSACSGNTDYSFFKVRHLNSYIKKSRKVALFPNCEEKTVKDGAKNHSNIKNNKQKSSGDSHKIQDSETEGCLSYEENSVKETVVVFNEHFDEADEDPLDRIHYGRLHDLYISYKYEFLAALDSYVHCFERKMFYEDLHSVCSPLQLLSRLGCLKTYIDWSDLISFACSSCCKEQFITFMFDPFYTINPKHSVYVELFYKSIRESKENLLYFTFMAIREGCWSILMESYFYGISSNDPFDRKRRYLILEGFLSQSTEIVPVKEENLIVVSAEDPSQGTITDAVGELNAKHKIGLSSSDFSSFSLKEKPHVKIRFDKEDITVKEKKKKTQIQNIASCAAISYFKKCDIFVANKNVSMLVTAVLSCSLSCEESLTVLLYLRKCLINASTDDIHYVCLCAWIMRHKKPRISECMGHIECYGDILIVLLYNMLRKKDRKKLLKRTHEESFKIFLVGLTKEQLNDLSLLDNKQKSSCYYQSYKKLATMLQN